MRLIDVVLRQGHLSETALAEAVLTGERPAHLERCDICASRAVELGRWLDDVRAMGVAGADAAFPPEKLAAQQAQILRRLEQLDEPSRVIAFPRQSRPMGRESTGRRVAPAWVGVAAAAGLVLGVAGSQFTARFGTLTAGPAVTPPVTADLGPVPPEAPLPTPVPIPIDLGDDGDRTSLPAIEAYDEMTPRAIKTIARR